MSNAINQKELLKNTPPGHKDRNFMEETMYCLEKLTSHVNECNLAAENEEKLLDVASTLTGLDIVTIHFLFITLFNSLLNNNWSMIYSSHL